MGHGKFQRDHSGKMLPDRIAELPRENRKSWVSSKYKLQIHARSLQSRLFNLPGNTGPTSANVSIYCFEPNVLIAVSKIPESLINFSICLFILVNIGSRSLKTNLYSSCCLRLVDAELMGLT